MTDLLVKGPTDTTRDERALAAFEALVLSQQPATEPWTPVTDYSWEARQIIEAPQAELIRVVFHSRDVLDVGCGPGHLVRLLQARDIPVTGIDLTTGHDITDRKTLPCVGYDLVICREVLEHLTVRQIRHAVTNLCVLSSRYIYVTTRFAHWPAHLLSVDTSDDLDPTHITLLNQLFLRTLFVLEGFRRRVDLEQQMDWQHKHRVLVYERA